MVLSEIHIRCRKSGARNFAGGMLVQYPVRDLEWLLFEEKTMDQLWEVCNLLKEELKVDASEAG